MVCTAADVLLKSESFSDLPKTTLTSDQRSCFSSLVAIFKDVVLGVNQVFGLFFLITDQRIILAIYLSMVY